MEQAQFKTNIKCAGCVANVTPFLNEAIGENNWSVDFNNPAKVLIVAGDAEETKVIESP